MHRPNLFSPTGCSLLLFMFEKQPFYALGWSKGVEDGIQNTLETIIQKEGNRKYSQWQTPQQTTNHSSRKKHSTESDTDTHKNDRELELCIFCEKGRTQDFNQTCWNEIKQNRIERYFNAFSPFPKWKSNVTPFHSRQLKFIWNVLYNRTNMRREVTFWPRWTSWNER